MSRNHFPAVSQPDAPAPDLQVAEAELRDALDAVVLSSLKPVALGIGVLYAVLAVAHSLVLPPAVAPTMVALASGTAAFLLALRVWLERAQPPPRWAHALAAIMPGLALLNTLAHIYLVAEPRQTTNLMLILIAVGLFFLSARWYASFVLATLAGWIVIVLNSPPSPDWQHYGFALFQAWVVSWLVFIVRVRTYRRLEGLRIQDELQKKELERRARQLATNAAVSQRITSILDLDALLDQLTCLIQEQYGYYYVGIFLLDDSGQYLVPRAGDAAVARALREQSFKLELGQGLVGWAAQSRRPVCVNDVSRESRYLGLKTILTATRSELALPLLMGETLLGVLDIQSERLGAFRPEDIPVFQSLADQAAIAIQNACLYQREQTRRQLAETLYNVGRALSSTLNLSDVLDLILERLADILAYDRAAILMQRGDKLEFVAARGFPPNALARQPFVPIREGDVFQELGRTRQPLSIADVSQRPDWQYVRGLPPAHAWLGVPLIRSDEVIGMLSLIREATGAYANDEITLAATFAGQAVIALENARLYDELRRFNQQLEDMVRERTRDLQAAYDKLERLDRAKSDFISIVSHELRTPLTTLRGCSQMLLSDPALRSNAAHTELVATIHTGAIRLHEIVNAMLDMAKIDNRTLQLCPEPLELAALLKQVCANFEKPLADRRLTLTLRGLAELPAIEADPDALAKVFYQLIVNAIKYTPDGGSIVVAGRALSGQDFPGGGVEIAVSDSGIGIDPRFHEVIFTKFYQTGQVALHSTGKTTFKGGGPGLGLAIARGIVQAHGGKIWVTSPGYDEQTCPGSSFYVQLPLHQKPPSA